MFSVEIFILIIIACISPLLTLAALWQTKEWRIDRIKEHLRSEGWLRQLFGTTRPIIMIIAIAINNVQIGIIAMAILSVAQIGLRRQRFPVWTMKAIVLISAAAFFTLICAFTISHASFFFVFLPLIQSIPLALAWLIFLPIDNTLKKKVMKKATKLRAEFSNLTVIGITGSVGKTTTKELLAHILEEHTISFTPAYVNSEMGVAKWILKELHDKDRHEKRIVIVEMGAYRKGEISRLCRIVQPDIGIITFIGTQHIALFGSQQNLCDAKTELFTALPENGHAFFNADSIACNTADIDTLCPLTTIGTARPCDVEAKDIQEVSNGIRFRIQDTQYHIPIHGTHNVTNALLAIVTAKYVQMPETDIVARLQTFSPPQNTFSVQEKNGVTLLDDTHNASPESFQAAIRWAQKQQMQNKILVTPGLIELGEDEDRIHTEIGILANGVFSKVIFTGKHGIDAFAKGYNGSTERYNKATVPVSKGDLLVCIGRVPQATINRILPQ